MLNLSRSSLSSLSLAFNNWLLLMLLSVEEWKRLLLFSLLLSSKSRLLDFELVLLLDVIFLLLIMWASNWLGLPQFVDLSWPLLLSLVWVNLPASILLVELNTDGFALILLWCILSRFMLAIRSFLWPESGYMLLPVAVYWRDCLVWDYELGWARCNSSYFCVCFTPEVKGLLLGDLFFEVKSQTTFLIDGFEELLSFKTV